MVCAARCSRHPAELRADFQRFYGIDLTDGWIEQDLGRASDLVANLPPNSCTGAAENPANAWTATEWLLSDISWHLRILAWHNTKDGHEGINPPERILPPGMRPPAVRQEQEAEGAVAPISADRYMDEIRKRRREARGG